MTAALYSIERAAIEAIIRQHSRLSDALIVQLGEATATNRRRTGTGFYTDLHISDHAPLVITASPIGKLFADVEGLEHGMGFLLWFANGKMKCLEGFSFEEPTTLIEFEVVVFSIIGCELI